MKIEIGENLRDVLGIFFAAAMFWGPFVCLFIFLTAVVMFG